MSTGCDFSGWYPDAALLVLVAGGPTFAVRDTAVFQDGVYAAGNFVQDAGSVVQGPRIADRLSISGSSGGPWSPFAFAGSSQSTFPPYTFLPPGAPQAKPFVTTNRWR